jgi:hypothetical protein
MECVQEIDAAVQQLIVSRLSVSDFKAFDTRSHLRIHFKAWEG